MYWKQEQFSSLGEYPTFGVRTASILRCFFNIYFKECNHKQVSSSYKNTINSNKNAVLTEVAAFIKSMYVYNMNTYSAERNFIFSCVKFIMALFFEHNCMISLLNIVSFMPNCTTHDISLTV